MVDRVLAKWADRREALWTPVKMMLADAQRALAIGDRERARTLSDQLFARYQIRFALGPGESRETS